jgi:hypothetical protein
MECGWEWMGCKKRNYSGKKLLYQTNPGNKFEKLASSCKLLELTGGQKPRSKHRFDRVGTCAWYK